jgi:CheY-like chemotaxis protein
VTVVTAGEQALELAFAQGFDVIISDLMMPRMSGMALFQAIRAHAPAQAERMIFMTGGAFTEATRSFLENVPNLRLEKPLDVAHLRALVRRVAAPGGGGEPS